MKYAVAVLLLLPIAFGKSGAETVTFGKSGPFKLHCACVTVASGCGHPFFDSNMKSNIHEWVQDANAIKGHTVNLDEACYRKRDERGHGEGLCCKDSSTEKTIDQMFRGTQLAK